MVRALVLAVGLALSAPALACGEGDCGGDKPCKMKSTGDLAAALEAFEKAEGDKVTLSVDGMKCGRCSDKLTAALTGVEGVVVAAVSHETGEAKIAFDAKKTDTKRLLSAIEQIGYKASVAAKS